MSVGSRVVLGSRRGAIDFRIQGSFIRENSKQNGRCGNQRETDRLKAQKKLQQTAKGKKESAASLQQRREKDAAALREKQKKKEEEKAGSGDGGTKK
ncbi:hypothetical protein TRAPUB_8905 [Trametes pubescens]|uniref:Small EDRK-rich factor-like N-terminal domain-containing protein n=1 Tax=Trametes pubescens TaxID=154538 RepID=A0A1M2W3U6_TRAPU|nr:hypothetical protein TRAPUB_8905 [Trametes pubescens]